MIDHDGVMLKNGATWWCVILIGGLAFLRRMRVLSCCSTPRNCAPLLFELKRRLHGAFSHLLFVPPLPPAATADLRRRYTWQQRLLLARIVRLTPHIWGIEMHPLCGYWHLLFFLWLRGSLLPPLHRLPISLSLSLLFYFYSRCIPLCRSCLCCVLIYRSAFLLPLPFRLCCSFVAPAP